jgi:hypothetical protein
MSKEKTNKNEKSGKEEPKEADKIIEATKKLADKAEQYVSETAAKVKKSETFEKLSGMFNKGVEFVEDKAEEFSKSDMTGKLETLKEKAGSKAEELLEKAKVAGNEIVREVDDAIDSIKEKMDQKKGGGKADGDKNK